MKTLTRGRVRTALGLAMLADLVQLGFVPLFGWGGLFLPNDALDVAVGVALVWLLGWHWAFLPSLVAEVVPALNLFPTWTTAVLFVTRGAPEDVRAELPPAVGAPPALPDSGSGQKQDGLVGRGGREAGRP
jgi:hypothetical protein